VANYEVSDYLQTRPEATSAAAAAGTPLRFVRFNEWPERGSATHEVYVMTA